FTHAERAEEEYRQLILQLPDSKLIPEAKEKLREVQEDLAEREFGIGRFYYLRKSWPAAIARLKSLSERYPLYSGADETLYMLGDCYETEIANVRSQPQIPEAMKGKLIKDFTDDAAAAYSRILTRYPATDRVEDAKRRLEALHRPVPQPTQEALAQSKAEEESRQETSRFGRIRGSFHKNPDVSEAARVGEPTLVDPKPDSPTQVLQEATTAIKSALPPAAGESNKASVDVINNGTPGPNQPVPRSDAPANTGDGSNGTGPAPAATSPAATASDSSSGSTGIEELKPEKAAAAPAQGAAQGTDTAAASDTQSDSAQPAPAPPQLNEAASGSTSATASSGSTDQPTQASNDSTSKKKKKKGLGKLNPF